MKNFRGKGPLSGSALGNRTAAASAYMYNLQKPVLEQNSMKNATQLPRIYIHKNYLNALHLNPDDSSAASDRPAHAFPIPTEKTFPC